MSKKEWVPIPVIDSMINVISVVMKKDYRKENEIKL